MPQVVDARFPGSSDRCPTQLSAQHAEGVVGGAVTDPVAAVIYVDTLAGVGFSPTEYVDITATIDLKLAALSAHTSQLTFLLDHDGVDVVEQTRVVNAAHRTSGRGRGSRPPATRSIRSR